MTPKIYIKNDNIFFSSEADSIKIYLKRENHEMLDFLYEIPSKFPTFIEEMEQGPNDDLSMMTYCYYAGNTNEWKFEKIIVNLTSASAVQSEFISSKEEIKRIGNGAYYRKKVDGRNQIFSVYGPEIYPKTSFQTIDNTNAEVTDISFYEISTPNDKNLIGMNLHFDNIATLKVVLKPPMNSSETFEVLNYACIEITNKCSYEYVPEEAENKYIDFYTFFDLLKSDEIGREIATIQTDNRKNISQIESGRNAALSRILQPTKLHEKPRN